MALSYGKSNLENLKRNLELNLEQIQFIYSNLNERNIFQATFGDTETTFKSITNWLLFWSIKVCDGASASKNISYKILSRDQIISFKIFCEPCHMGHIIWFYDIITRSWQNYQNSRSKFIFWKSFQFNSFCKVDFSKLVYHTVLNYRMTPIMTRTDLLKNHH